MEVLKSQPDQTITVAHPGDLQAAALLDLKTALEPRPLECGAAAAVEPIATEAFDVVAIYFCDLAAQLGG